MTRSLQRQLLLLLVFLVGQLSQLRASQQPTWRADIEANYFQWVERVGVAVNGTQSAQTGNPMNAPSQLAARIITVNQKGMGNFRTVQAAVNSIMTGNKQRVIIQIAAGTYKEKVKIPKTKPYVTLQGDSHGGTAISWHDNTKSAGSTFKSASVAIMSDYFVAKDITFVNTAPYPKPSSTNMQAVALQISGDKGAFYNCRFFSTQDTLYDHKGRHYFYNCYLQGSVDFICGDGLSLYENCNLHAISNGYGSFTAQHRRNPQGDTGFSFVNCRMTGSGILYLGRAWGPYSRVVFITSYIDAQVAPGGWYNWGQSSREKTVFYGTYKCKGPGASLNGRVGWSHELTAGQAAPFMSLGFIDGEEWVSTQ